jgi:hypothetical protein
MRTRPPSPSGALTVVLVVVVVRVVVLVAGVPAQRVAEARDGAGVDVALVVGARAGHEAGERREEGAGRVVVGDVVEQGAHAVARVGHPPRRLGVGPDGAGAARGAGGGGERVGARAQGPRVAREALGQVLGDRTGHAPEASRAARRRRRQPASPAPSLVSPASAGRARLAFTYVPSSVTSRTT